MRDLPSRTCTATCTPWPRSPRTTRAHWTAASPTWCRAARALSAVDDPDRDTAWGWHDLAMAYSLPRLPRLRAERHRAGPAARRSPPASRRRPSPRRASGCATPSPSTTTATATGACGCSGTSPPTWTGSSAPAGPRGCARAACAAYGYAIGPAGRPRRRRSNHRPGRSPTRPGCSPTAATAPGPGTCASSARSCLAIAAGRLRSRRCARLEASNVVRRDARRGRTARLRSLAYARAGDHAAAHRADRYAFRLAAQRNDRLRDVYVDGIAARIDHEEMRREAARYEGEALTDPLTGLPNRRRLERYVADSGEPAASVP